MSCYSVTKKHGVILITFHLPTSCPVCCPHIRKKNEGVVVVAAVVAVAVVGAAANAVHRLKTNLEQNFVSNVGREKNNPQEVGMNSQRANV